MSKKAGIILALLFMLFGSGTGLAAAAIASPNAVTNTTSYCVKFGNGAGASGNVVEFNWDNSPCPPGTYEHSLKVTDSDPFLVPTFFLTSGDSNFTSNHTGVVFRISDTTTGFVYDCHLGVPTAESGTAPVPGGIVYDPSIACVRA